jgi:hypothetical protein
VDVGGLSSVIVVGVLSVLFMVCTLIVIVCMSTGVIFVYELVDL